MTVKLPIRKLTSSWIDSGYKASAIYQMLNQALSKATVYRWVDRIYKSEVSARTSPGRRRSVRTKSFIAKVKRNVCLNKKIKSARKIAREEGCDHKTIGQVIRQNLGLKA